MSYILDALKKSEKDRRRGTVPDILTVQDTLSKKPEKRHPWLYPVIAVLLLITGVFIWWSGAWNIKRTKSDPQSTVAQQNEIAGKETPLPSEVIIDKPDIKTSGNAADKNKVPEHQETAEKPSDAGLTGWKMGTAEEPKPQVRNNPAPAVVAAPDKIPPAAIPQTQVKEENEAGQKTVDTDAVPEKNRIYTLNDLPLSIRQKLPAFNITLSMYSDDPASRMVRINGQMIREGQNLNPEIKLEEIAQNGVILNYRNFRFHVGTK